MVRTRLVILVAALVGVVVLVVAVVLVPRLTSIGLAAPLATGASAVHGDPPRTGDPASTGDPAQTGDPDQSDGVVPSGSPIEPTDDVPAISRLDPALRSAVQRAAVAARADGVHVLVTSGWRSHRYQQRLLDDAVREHGEAEARRLVQTPSGSRHTSGEAVDIGFTDADDWVNRHGSAYGLCQVYANEMWHFELRTTPGGECPAMRSDASAG